MDIISLKWLKIHILHSIFTKNSQFRFAFVSVFIFPLPTAWIIMDYSELLLNNPQHETLLRSSMYHAYSLEHKNFYPVMHVLLSQWIAVTPTSFDHSNHFPQYIFSHLVSGHFLLHAFAAYTSLLHFIDSLLLGKLVTFSAVHFPEYK